MYSDIPLAYGWKRSNSGIMSAPLRVWGGGLGTEGRGEEQEALDGVGWHCAAVGEWVRESIYELDRGAIEQRGGRAAPWRTRRSRTIDMARTVTQRGADRSNTPVSHTSTRARTRMRVDTHVVTVSSQVTGRAPKHASQHGPSRWRHTDATATATDRHHGHGHGPCE